MRGGAIVPLEADDPGAGEVLLEAQDVVDFRTAPAIDRLVVVADAADIDAPSGGAASRLRALGQKTQPHVLGRVGVLVLVDENVFELRVVVLQHVRMFPEDADGMHEQIAEVARVQRPEACLVGRVELATPAVGEGARVALGYLGRPEPLVLPAIDHLRELARRPALVVEAVGLDQLLDQPHDVVGIEDREIGSQPGQLRVAAKELDADRVEGAEPGHALDGMTDENADALLHLACRLVGEGDRQDLRGKGPARRQYVGDARRQDAGLAGAGAGKHQHGAVERLDRLGLFRIQAGKVGSRTPRGVALGDGARGNPASRPGCRGGGVSSPKNGILSSSGAMVSNVVIRQGKASAPGRRPDGGRERTTAPWCRRSAVQGGGREWPPLHGPQGGRGSIPAAFYCAEPLVPARPPVPMVPPAGAGAFEAFSSSIFACRFL